VDKGFITPERAKSLSEREALELIFLPGMSTAEKVNNVSGRGVGMDVVRSNVKRLNGTIEIASTAGSGTSIHLRVPLTMAILPVLLVEVSDEVYALPLRSVQETLRVAASQIHRIEGREVLCLPDISMPLLRLSEILNVSRTCPESLVQRAVVLAIGELRIALLVDRLIGQESTVIKSMGDFLHHCPSIAGATISGDGRVRLVLDPRTLIEESSSL
jgi:two-component system chemotaxis sensor kinase CheA